MPDSNFENKLVKKEDFAVGRPDAQSYLVTWDGKQYDIHNITGWTDAHWIGNVALADSSQEGTGEPFLFISDFANNVTLIIAAEAGEHTYNLDYRYYVYQPIDPKYLPGVCLPVVELSTTVESGATFTKEENAALTVAFDSGYPLVLKADFNDGTSTYQNVATCAQTATVGANKAMIVHQGSTVYQIISTDGKTWAVI